LQCRPLRMTPGCQWNAVLPWLVQHTPLLRHSTSRPAKGEPLLTCSSRYNSQSCNGVIVASLFVSHHSQLQLSFVILAWNLYVKYRWLEHVNTPGEDTRHLCTTALVVSRCMAGKRSGLPTLLTTARTLPEQTCEMQCSNPSAPDVSCGGTNDSVSVYVFKGSQGECGKCTGHAAVAPTTVAQNPSPGGGGGGGRLPGLCQVLFSEFVSSAHDVAIHPGPHETDQLMHVATSAMSECVVLVQLAMCR
jgi:hypothetical protein